MHDDILDVNHNPMQHFQQWFYKVEQHNSIVEVNTMTLSTIGIDGYPKNRIVLLKRFAWDGFTFFTNYTSEKGIAITHHDKVSLHFDWRKAHKQVIIQGTTTKIASNLSDGYFDSRPEGSKLGAWASKQSEIISSKKVLTSRLEHYNRQFKNKSIPRPEYWGGYLVTPIVMEFIDTSSARSHLHEKYSLQNDYSWKKESFYNY